jgi:hypothetical protein
LICPPFPGALLTLSSVVDQPAAADIDPTIRSQPEALPNRNPLQHGPLPHLPASARQKGPDPYHADPAPANQPPASYDGGIGVGVAVGDLVLVGMVVAVLVAVAVGEGGACTTP